jgi:hypothetical protein
MTEEEIVECRHSAMMMLDAAEEASVELDEETITDLLGEQFYVNARQRMEMLPRDQIAQFREEARRTAWEYVYGIFELEPESFDLAFLECRYFLVYSPEQLELAAHSPTAKELLLDGVLLTQGEIASLAWEEGGAHVGGAHVGGAHVGGAHVGGAHVGGAHVGGAHVGEHGDLQVQGGPQQVPQEAQEPQDWQEPRLRKDDDDKSDRF